MLDEQPRGPIWLSRNAAGVLSDAALGCIDEAEDSGPSPEVRREFSLTQSLPRVTKA